MNFFFKLFICLSITRLVYSTYDLNVVHLEQLSSNLEKVFDSRANDSILRVIVNKQEYLAHNNILSSASSYLREQINRSKRKGVLNLSYLKLAHSDSFSHVLKYIYTGKLILGNQEIDRIFDFMFIAKRFHLTSLSEEISQLLIEDLTLENVALIYEEANRFDQKQLKESCEKFIDQNVEILADHRSLANLSGECLKEIIGRDSFVLNESKVFKLVEDWHVFHNREKAVNSDLIRQIRFDLIPPEELIRLTNQSNSISEEKANQTVQERISPENSNLPTRQITTTTTTTTTTITTTTSTTTTETTTPIEDDDDFGYVVGEGGDEYQGSVNSLLFLPKNKLASGASDNSIKIWNIGSGKCVRTLAGHSEFVTSLKLLPNSKLVSGSYDDSVKIWNVDSGECIRTLKGHSSTITSLQALANNQLASGSDDATIKIWNIESGQCIRTLTEHSGAITSFQLLANNQLASGSEDKSINIWNVDSGEFVRVLNGHSNTVTSMQLLANNQLASGSWDHSIKIWSIDSGACVRTLTGHSRYVTSLQLLANNQLASGSDDTTIKIWNVDSGECIRTLTGHASSVLSLQLLANNTLASGSDDTSIKIWNIVSGECVRTLQGHSY